MQRKLKNVGMLLMFVFCVNLLVSTQVQCRKTHDLKAVIMSTSKFWFNFRQGTNALLIYSILRNNGVRDEDILLLIPENVGCNARNNNPGVVCYVDGEVTPNLYRNAEIDYKLHDVNVKNLANILRGRYLKYTPRSKRLVTNYRSKIMTYFTGHGGSGYLKMQDTDVMMDGEINILLQESYEKRLYGDMFMVNDSCAAATIYEEITSPNIYAIGSSSRGEYSYSYSKDAFLGLSVVDK